MQSASQQALETSNDSYVRSHIFISEEHMRRSFTHLCYGDLYIIGRLWIAALKVVLVGSKMNLVPVVKAAPPPEPKKPPPMKYKELPLYETPHHDYKDHETQKESCPAAKEKLVHKKLLPTVKKYRASVEQTLQGIKKEGVETYNEIGADLVTAKKKLLSYFRDPANDILRKLLVVGGGAAGHYIGWNKGIPRRMFYTAFGALMAGGLCYPKETDETIRGVSHEAGKVGTKAYNFWFGTDHEFPERIPCKTEPPKEEPKSKNICPPKKK